MARRRGFTLVELVVAVALLAVMAAVVLPRLVAPAPDPALELGRIVADGSLAAQREGAVHFLLAQEMDLVLARPGPSAEDKPLEVRRYSLGGRLAVRLIPERLLFYPDGSFEPTGIVVRGPTSERAFHLTVTGQLLEIKTEGR